jgi:hypothetical protein
MMMRGVFIRLLFVVAVGGGLAGSGCGDDVPARPGAGGRGGASGTGGPGGGVAGTGGGGQGGGCPVGTGGVPPGGSTQSPQQIHEGLLNAPTSGGIVATRPQPPVGYPTCP